MNNPVRVAVIGAGAFGRNHLRVLRDLEKASAHESTSESTVTQLAALVDPEQQVRETLSRQYGIPSFSSVEALLAADLGIHAATVAVPTLRHAEVAAALLQADLDILVEKPLTSTLAEADRLIELASAKQRVFAVGHLERFNPCVSTALERLTAPKFFEAHRLSVFTPRSLDVDVVLDLMIHDLDILLVMANSPVEEVRAVGLPILSGKVDIANVRLEFASGAVANLTASRVSTEQVRKLRLFQPGQYLSLDYARQELLAINVETTQGQAPALPKDDASAAVPAQASGPQPHPSRGLSFQTFTPPRIEPLRLELEDFLFAVAHRTAPRVNAAAARQALALALDINAAIAQHAGRAGLATPRAAL